MILMLPVAAVLGAGVGWATAPVLTSLGVGAVSYPNNQLPQMRIWVDAETGCQYFVTDPATGDDTPNPTGITPRRNVQGNPMCRATP
jgi:hypothetical protein